MDFGKLAYSKAHEFERAKESGGVGYVSPEAVIFQDWAFTLSEEENVLVHPQRANIDVGCKYKLTNGTGTLEGVAAIITDADVNVMTIDFDGLVQMIVVPEGLVEDIGFGTALIAAYWTDANPAVVTLCRVETTYPIEPKFLPDGGSGVGYTEPGKVYTYDGNPNVVEQVTIGELRTTAAYIASNAPHLDSIVSVTATAINGTQLTATAEEMQLITYNGDEMLTYKLAGYGTLPVAFWSNGELYAFYSADIGYCSRIEFAETIHTIDPKFLPQSSGSNTNDANNATNDFMVSLPRVILSDDPDNITAAESNLLDAAWETGLPCIIEYRDLESHARKCVCATRVQTDGDYPAFHFDSFEWPKVRRTSGGKWSYQWGGEA